jgi:chromate transporter
VKPLGDALLVLLGQFALMSLLAFGGANAVIPEIHRQAVQTRHWMTDADFTSLFAISQAAPGPNFMISTLVGWKVAGIPGALVATIAMCGPSCILAFVASKLWDRVGDSPWRRVVAAGLAPVTVGLVSATFWLLARAADTNLRLALVTAAALAVGYATRLNFLWTLAAAAGLGLLGYV